MGLATSLRRADPAWGQWSIQGPVSAAHVRAVGFYNLVRQGPVVVGRWLRLTSRATQALMGLDVAPRKGTFQANVSAAPLDGGSRIGWTIRSAPSATPPSRATRRKESELGGPQQRAATSTSSRGGSGSQHGTPAASGRTSDSPSPCGKRKPSPRTSEKASRRRRSASTNASSSSSVAPPRPAPSDPKGLRGGMSHGKIARLLRLLIAERERWVEQAHHPSSASGASSSTRGASSDPSSRGSRGGRDQQDPFRGKGAKRK